jgi:hypothetical protein
MSERIDVKDNALSSECGQLAAISDIPVSSELVDNAVPDAWIFWVPVLVSRGAPD